MQQVSKRCMIVERGVRNLVSSDQTGKEQILHWILAITAKRAGGKRKQVGRGKGKGEFLYLHLVAGSLAVSQGA